MGILTTEQRKQWKTEGYIVLKGVLSPDRSASIVGDGR